MDNEEYFSIENNDDNDNNNNKSDNDISEKGKSLGEMTNSYYKEDSEENSKIYLSKKIENEKEIRKDLSNKNSLYNSYKNNYLQSEEIFINQKKEIEKEREKNLLFLKRKNKTNDINNIINTDNDNINNTYNKNYNSNNINNIELEQKIIKEDKDENNINSNNDKNKIKKNEPLIFSLKDNQYFEVTLFDYTETDEEKSKIPEFKESWKPFSSIFSLFLDNSLENQDFIPFNKIALRSTQEIDYSKKGLELNIKFTLYGESQLWIFTRCSVNKSINESYYFDEISENIEENDDFNKYSSVIKIIKVRNSNKCFVIFGTFYQEIYDNNRLYYKSFLKRQLIDNSEIDKDDSFYFYGENDYCEFEIYVADYGEELINTKIFLNNNKKFNDISGKFFLPINKKAKFMVCGNGKKVQVQDLNVKIYDKDNYNFKTIIQFESDNENPKNCECCLIT